MSGVLDTNPDEDVVDGTTSNDNHVADDPREAMFSGGDAGDTVGSERIFVPKNARRHRHFLRRPAFCHDNFLNIAQLRRRTGRPRDH